MGIITSETLGPIYEKFKEQTAVVRATTDALISELAVTSAGIHLALEIYRKCIINRGRLAKFVAIPGIADYAKTAEDNPLYDLLAECQAMDTAIAGVMTWIATNMPKDANGWWGWVKVEGDVVTIRSFTPAATAGLRTALQAVVDAIEAR